MDHNTRLRARDRSLATELLRDLTILTAAGGLAATAGFGWLASMTYAGTPGATGASNDAATANDPVTPQATQGSQGVNGSSAAQRPVVTPRPVAGSGGSSSGGTVSGGFSGSRRRGHVSTGSS